MALLSNVPSSPHPLPSQRVLLLLRLLLFLALMCIGTGPVVQALTSAQQKERQRQLRLGLEQDPNVQFQCRGALGEFVACLCNEEARELACINAQFVDTGVFQYLNGHYDSVEQLTFHGNNFQDLPEGPLFGSHTLDRLRVLNISANYIVNLHRDALKSTPNIEVLDLSNNEIVLSEENVHFLVHTPHLKKLYLRRAFTSPLNRSAQFALMMRMFEKADLRKLELLDLSYNFFSSVPLQLPCPFPSLRHLDLRQNLLNSLSLNTSCLAHIGTINLERNYLHSLDPKFRSFASELAAKAPLAQFLLRNSFFCDCSSAEWIQWMRSRARMFSDYRLLTCSRASPQRLTGSRLSEVPLHQLDCQSDLLASSSSSFALPPVSSILMAILLLILINDPPM